MDFSNYDLHVNTFAGGRIFTYIYSYRGYVI